MKNFFLWLAAFSALALHAVQVGDGEARKQRAVSVPDGVRLIWENSPWGWSDVVYDKPVSLGKVDGQRVTMTLAGRPEGFANIRLRLRDSNGEIFQYDPVRPGFLPVVTFLLTPGGFRGYWGGDRNRRIDGDARIIGFALGFTGKGTSGDVTVGNPQVFASEEEAAVTEKRTRVLDFAGETNWRLVGRTPVVAATSAGSVVDAARTRHFLMIDRERDKAVPLRRPVRARLRATLLEGTGSLGLVVRAADGKDLVVGKSELKPGANELEFDLSQITKDQPTPGIAAWSPEGDLLVRLESLDVFCRSTVPEAVDVEVETGSPVRHVLPGEEKKVRLLLTNRGGKDAALVLELRLSDFFGRSIASRRSIALKAGERISLPVAERLPARGIWYVDYTLRDSGGKTCPAIGRRSFAVMAPAGETAGFDDGFKIGVNTHSEQWSSLMAAREIEAAALAGAKTVRCGGISGGAVARSMNSWDYRLIDNLVNLGNKHHVEFQLMLADAPGAWAWDESVPPCDQSKPRFQRCPNLDYWRLYIRNTVTHLKGRVRLYEQWNEPELRDFANFPLDAYLRLCKTTAPIVRECDPGAFLMSGGLTGIGEPLPLQYLEEILKNGGVDAVAYHRHGTFQNYVIGVDGELLPRLRKYGCGRWYSTETGITSRGGLERLQAETLWMKLLFAWSRGAVGYQWYDLRNDGYSSDSGESNYGMITRDFYPKAVYVAFNELAKHFRGAEFVREIPVRRSVRLMEFRRDGEIRLAAWKENDTTLGNLLLATDAEGVEAYDLMGNPLNAELRDGVVFLGFDVPSLLILKGATRCAPAGELLGSSFGGTVLPGRETPLRLRLSNPLKTEAEFQLKMHTPEKLTSGSGEYDVRVPANATKEITIPVRAAKEFRLPFGGREQLWIDYRLSGTNWGGRFSLPVYSAVFIAAGDFAGPPDFKLADRSRNETVVVPSPSTDHRLWRGPDDLSVEVRLACRDGRLLLRVDAVDDIFSQPFGGGEMWRGDSVQFALVLPDRTGMWEIGLARRDDGQSEIRTWSAPDGLDASSPSREGTLKTERKGNRTRYEAAFPLESLGLTRELLESGIRFNLLVNDNDGEGRDGWMHIVPGIGGEKRPDQYPVLVFGTDGGRTK